MERCLASPFVRPSRTTEDKCEANSGRRGDVIRSEISRRCCDNKSLVRTYFYRVLRRDTQKPGVATPVGLASEATLHELSVRSARLGEQSE